MESRFANVHTYATKSQSTKLDRCLALLAPFYINHNISCLLYTAIHTLDFDLSFCSIDSNQATASWPSFGGPTFSVNYFDRNKEMQRQVYKALKASTSLPSGVSVACYKQVYRFPLRTLLVYDTLVACHELHGRLRSDLCNRSGHQASGAGKSL